ncbi:hypothetical protein BLOT_008944 [Blomia tropicalis]|nr:hypothetical protein BLOT_008944 [Blomia tropicalis]
MIDRKATVPCKQTNRLADWQTSTSSIVNVTVATSLLTRFYMGPQSPLVGCLPVVLSQDNNNNNDELSHNIKCYNCKLATSILALVSFTIQIEGNLTGSLERLCLRPAHQTEFTQNGALSN